MRTPAKDKMKSKITTFLVFDYMEHDFQGLLRRRQNFSRVQVKCVMQQLFRGLQYLHKSNIIHRDLKSANILLNKEGILKIGDFGLAREIEKPLLRPLTSVVVTLWYRAPEILLGDKDYGFKSDVWSAGCFLAELLLGEPLFTGKVESAQAEQIYERCGTPDQDSWSGLTKFKFWKELQPKKECTGNLISFMKQKLGDIDSTTLDFLQELLTMNPDDRLDSTQALQHEYFEMSPLPCKPSELPQLEQDCHFQPSRSGLNSQDHMPNPTKRFNQTNNGYSGVHHRPGTSQDHYDNMNHKRNGSFNNNSNYLSDVTRKQHKRF